MPARSSVCIKLASNGKYIDCVYWILIKYLILSQVSQPAVPVNQDFLANLIELKLSFRDDKGCTEIAAKATANYKEG